MTRVLVYAYCGNNFGDDLFVDMLVKRYPEATFDLLCPDWSHIRAFQGHPRVNIIGLRGFRSEAAKFDAFVMIGGSMFQQVRGWWRAWGYLASLLLITKLSDIPAVALGLSFGPARTQLFIAANRLLLRKFSWVSMRDRRSIEQVGLPAIRCFPDLAFAIPRTAGGKAPGLVGVSVMDFGPGVTMPGYRQYMTELVTGLTKQLTVKLFSFQEDAGINDAAVIESVLASLPAEAKHRVSVSRYLTDPLVLAAEIQACESFVATRLHSLILAARGGAEVAVIRYHSKIANLIETTGLQVQQISPDDLIDPQPLIEQVLNGELPYTPDEVLECLAEQANGHFQHLDALLAIGREKQA